MTIFGLPLHVLVVHAAVIFVPLAAVGILVTGWREDWRKSYTFPLLLIAVAGAIAAVIAASSGEDLEESIREAANQRVGFGDHPEEGETAATSRCCLLSLLPHSGQSSSGAAASI